MSALVAVQRRRTNDAASARANTELKRGVPNSLRPTSAMSSTSSSAAVERAPGSSPHRMTWHEGSSRCQLRMALRWITPI